MTSDKKDTSQQPQLSPNPRAYAPKKPAKQDSYSSKVDQLESKLEKKLGFRNRKSQIFFDAIGRQFTCMMSNQLLACWNP